MSSVCYPGPPGQLNKRAVTRQGEPCTPSSSAAPTSPSWRGPPTRRSWSPGPPSWGCLPWPWWTRTASTASSKRTFRLVRSGSSCSSEAGSRFWTGLRWWPSSRMAKATGTSASSFPEGGWPTPRGRRECPGRRWRNAPRGSFCCCLPPRHRRKWHRWPRRFRDASTLASAARFRPETRCGSRSRSPWRAGSTCLSAPTTTCTPTSASGSRSRTP